MRSLGILMTGALIAFASCSGGDKKAGPFQNGGVQPGKPDSSRFTTIQWLDSTNRDFGKIPEGEKLEVSYRFRNTGDQPLVIEKVQPSCGCTIAEQPDEPVAPGKEGVIKAAFNSENHLGTNHKTLFVYANVKNSRSQELQFEVVVEKKKW